ncbi:MAG: ATP-dependent 26S proteasome regulatory subunit [Paracoccaceae bacterium]
MNAALLKRLFSAIRQGSDSDVVAVCDRIVEDEKRLGHNKLAADLEKSLVAAKARRREPPNGRKSSSAILSSLPSNKRDSAPLVQVIKHSELRHHMVLPSEIDGKFHRIEQEFAARSRLAAHGLKARKRILLYGPPGCGKSLGAERLAWATGLPLHRVRFDTLISSYFGETAANLGKVFEAAERQPCALFLDECDTIARARGDRNDVGEVSRVVNMLLQLLEDYRGEGLVIAATNFYESLDTAIYRRFDEAIEIPTPGITEIARLLKMSLASLKVDNSIDFGQFAGSLDGFSFSEVERTAQNAAKRCIMDNRKIVQAEDLQFSATEVKRHA